MNVDMIPQIGAITREVEQREHEGKARRAVAATCTYATAREDVWDAITRPERLARWFSTVTGDLRLGGSFQIKDVARGEITACQPPQMLAFTWKAFGDVSWVEVQLSPAPNGGTRLRVEHILWGASSIGSTGRGSAPAQPGSAGSSGCWA